MKELVVGTVTEIGGSITTLNAIWPGAERETEKQLGYQPGRLSRGYHILLLNVSLTASDFQLFGTTLRSDGRVGLPSRNCRRRSRTTSRA